MLHSLLLIPSLYAYVLVLYAITPGPIQPGYATSSGPKKEPLLYKLNGLRVLFLLLATFVSLCYFNLLKPTDFYDARWGNLIVANLLGLLFSIACVEFKPKSLREFFLGRYWNPRYGLVDAKMFLYLLGASVLELNLLSFAAKIYVNEGTLDWGILVYVFLFSFFVLEYLYHEHVHLYTYDFVAEKVGFKLGWGCLVFYPFFYVIGLWSVVESPSERTKSPTLPFLSVFLFFAGYILSRGANNQKYKFKTSPSATFLGIKPLTIGNVILCSGWWGISRHVNYLGEILMSIALAIVCGSWVAWFYPLYYLLLLIPRERDDNNRCHEKYGILWDHYCKKVPWRIVPYVY